MGCMYVCIYDDFIDDKMLSVMVLYYQREEELRREVDAYNAMRAVETHDHKEIVDFSVRSRVELDTTLKHLAEEEDAKEAAILQSIEVGLYW